jgi:hypothetical protein
VTEIEVEPDRGPDAGITAVMVDRAVKVKGMDKALGVKDVEIARPTVAGGDAGERHEAALDEIFVASTTSSPKKQ